MWGELRPKTFWSVLFFFQFFENFGSKFSRDWEGISRDWEGTAEIGRWDISYRYPSILSGDMGKSASFSIWGTWSESKQPRLGNGIFPISISIHFVWGHGEISYKYLGCLIRIHSNFKLWANQICFSCSYFGWTTFPGGHWPPWASV